MRSAYFSLLVRVFLGVATLSASAFALTYVVKKGDTLSTIAGQTTQGRIYGKKGALKKLLTLNPQVKDQDLIFPGDKITLSPEDNALAASSPESSGDSSPPVAATRDPASSSDENKNTNVPSDGEDQGTVISKEVSPGGEPEFESFSEIVLTPDFRYYRVDGKQNSNGTTATLLSSLSPGAMLSWCQHWSERFRSSLGLNATWVKVESSSQRSITEASHVLTGIGASAEWDFNKNLHSSFFLGTHDELFYWAPSTSALEVDRVTIPRFSSGVNYDFHHYQGFVLTTGLDALLLFPAKKDEYDIKTGYGYGVSFGVVQTPREKKTLRRLKGDLYFEQQFQNTSIIDRNQKVIGLRFGLEWDFLK